MIIDACEDKSIMGDSKVIKLEKFEKEYFEEDTKYLEQTTAKKRKL